MEKNANLCISERKFVNYIEKHLRGVRSEYYKNALQTLKMSDDVHGIDEGQLSDGDLHSDNESPALTPDSDYAALPDTLFVYDILSNMRPPLNDTEKSILFCILNGIELSSLSQKLNMSKQLINYHKKKLLKKISQYLKG